MNVFFRQIKKINSNFAVRIFTRLMAVILLLTGVLNFIYFREQQQDLKEGMISDGRLLAEMVAYNARLGVFAEDVEEIQSAARATFRAHDVMGVCVYNWERELLAAVSGERFPNQRARCLSTDGEFLVDVTEEGAMPFFDDEENGVMEFWSPVSVEEHNLSDDALYFEVAKEQGGASREIIGYTQVIMTREPFRERMREAIFKTAIIFACVLLLGAVITSLIVREVTGPLNKLIDVIRGYGIAIDKTDQLGSLAGTFDSLIGQLGKSFATINELRKGLEGKVRELEHEVAIREDAEHALRESEETARALLNIPVNSAALLDVEGRILDANESMAERLSKDLAGLNNKKLWNLLPEEDILAKHREDIEGAMARGETLRFEGEHGVCYFDYTILPIPDATGQANKMAILARDITRRVMVERERQEMEVKALTQAKLASLGQISAGIAHEINQPLSFIKVIYESTLRDIEQGHLDEEELREDFTEALRQVGRITLLTDHLRNFGRPDQGRFEPVFLPAVLDRTMILMGESIKNRNIILHRDIEENLGPVKGNTNKLEQVFINLLQNGVDALESEAGGEITVAMYREENGQVTTRISDSGPGVPRGMQDSIFEPFFTTKEVGKGTGLGLAIVYGIIQEHKGTIHYQSTPAGQEGFFMTLPADEGEEG